MESESAMPEAVVTALLELTREIASLRQTIGELRQENATLREQLEQAQRAAARQAAPFRRRKERKKDQDDKKPPGRKAGHKGVTRPTPEQVDQEHDVPLERCPDCGGEITDVTPIVQYIEEIPPVRPVVHRVTTYQACCRHCGPVRSTHPLQTTRRPGVSLGPRAAAIAVALNKQLGLTMRKTCRVLRQVCGLKLSPGGLSQLADRLADRLEPAYRELIGTIRGSPAVNADETSWWVGGPGWWLWVFTTPNTTVYRVDSTRASTVVIETLGDDYAGVLGSDCLASYDPIDCRKHKCISHHLQAIKKARAMPRQETMDYLDAWRAVFKAVIVLHKLAVADAVDAADLAAGRAHLESTVDALLARPLTQLGDIRVRNRLAKRRAHLLTCLYDLHADPTNNAAERSLRPAVIARKVSCGNKTDRGRRTWEILASLGATMHQRGVEFIDYLAGAMAIAPAS